MSRPGFMPREPVLIPPRGSLILSLSNDDFAEEVNFMADEVTIRGCTDVASYNWRDRQGEEASILVPGQPPMWTPLSGTERLSEDGGVYFRDKHAAWFPNHPMAPTVAACLATSPEAPYGLDVVACGSTLGNLLQFVCGIDKRFRILVERVGNSVFFIRRGNSPTEVIPDVRGFGHSFPEAYTTWAHAVRRSVSHQRIVRYAFGGLDLLVRYEADGYITASRPDRRSQNIRNGQKNPQSQRLSLHEVDDLTDLLSNNTVQGFQHTPAPRTNFTIERRGDEVPLAQLFDLKTRSFKFKDRDHMAEELPRLWIKQIPTFILAFHVRAGEFSEDRIHIRDARPRVRQWEQDHQRQLKRLAALMKRIVQLALHNESAAGKFEICHDTFGRLDIRQQLPDAGTVLPRELRQRWAAASRGAEDGADVDGGVTLAGWDEDDEDDEDDADDEY